MTEPYIGPPYIPSAAVRKTRLIDFDASYAPNGYALKSAHKEALDALASFVAHTSSFSYWLIGYASKIGNHASNQVLSSNRALAVEQYLSSKNSLFGDPDRLQVFEFRGDEGYTAPADDNSADERAVEVHIFLGNVKPPPPPPSIVPAPSHKIPLPGGDRFTKWSVASPGGVFVSVVVGGGFNVFFIRNETTQETRGYIQPIGGVGASLGISGLKMVWDVVQQVLTGGSLSAPSFEKVNTPHPVTWEEIEGCLVRVSSAGAGVVRGYSVAIITFASGGNYVYGPSGFPLQISEQLFQFMSTGANWQIGVGGNVGVGPLVRAD